MTKLALAVIATVVLVAGVLLWKADANALTAPNPAAGTSYSQIEKAGCKYPGRFCRAGFKWTCGPYAAVFGHRCRCAPC